MPKNDEVFENIDRFLVELNSMLSIFWDWKIKSSISKAQEEIEKESVKSDLKIIIKPFLLANNTKNDKIRLLFFKFFAYVCGKLNLPLTSLHELLKELRDIDYSRDDIYIGELCKLSDSLFTNYNSRLCLPTKYLSKLLNLLYSMFLKTAKHDMIVNVRKSIEFINDSLFERYMNPYVSTKSKDVNKLAKNVSYLIVKNSLTVIGQLGMIIEGKDYTPTIRDAEIAVVFQTLTKAIYNTKTTPVLSILLELLIEYLELESEFYDTSTFRYILQNDIHMTLLSVLLNHNDLAERLSRIILIIWSKHKHLYLDNLYELLNTGLLSTLSSPNLDVLFSTMTIISNFLVEPQFFVEIFINYDCNVSGLYSNVFQNLMEKIIKLSYPGSISPEVQNRALSLVIKLLQSLWGYFINFKPPDTVLESPNEFLDAKITKEKFDVGLEIFRRSYKKGIAFFIENEFVKNDNKSIAQFLYDMPTLDNVSVGNVIGDANNQEILKYYVNCFDFRNTEFEVAFRSFLQEFHIPGEAQMIDRIMEQFSSKYYNDNPGVFTCADSVFSLSFSCLMLHTDAHHPAIKKHMTLEQFIKNNRGQNNGDDFPVDLLQRIYKNITSKEIYFNKSESVSLSMLTLEQRSELYESQCKKILEDIKSRSLKYEKVFHISSSPVFIGPMFQSIWGGILGSLTMTFQQTDTEKIYKSCFLGLQLSVNIASQCYVSTALDTLIDSVSKFTNLQKVKRVMTPKNINCFECLMDIAIENKNFLIGTWEIILSEASNFLKIMDELETSFLRIEIIRQKIERLFTITESMDSESIKSFTVALISVCNKELNEKSPRQVMFKYIPILFTSISNKAKVVFLDNWNVIKGYITSVSNKGRSDLIMVAADIIRQLSKEFLKKGESDQYHFQESFLHPLQEIFENLKASEPKIFIHDCLEQITNEIPDKLHSAWKIIFNVLKISAHDNTDVRNSGYLLFQSLLIDKMKHLANYHDTLLDLVKIYTSNDSKEIKKLSSIITDSDFKEKYAIYFK